MSAVDWTKVGSYPVGNVKIVGLKPKGDKLLFVKLEGIEGKAILAWKDAKGRDPLTEGMTLDAIIEVKEGKEYNGEIPLEYWLSTPKKSGGGGYSGGSKGGNYQPKDEAPIACQVMIKEACEIARFEAINKGEKEISLDRVADIFDKLADSYVDNYTKVKKVHGS